MPGLVTCSCVLYCIIVIVHHAVPLWSGQRPQGDELKKLDISENLGRKQRTIATTGSLVHFSCINMSW